MNKVLTLLVALLMTTSLYAQQPKNKEATKTSITLETAYIIYAIDKNNMKFKFKLDKGNKINVANGKESYLHYKLGKVKIIKKEKYSQRTVGGSWDYPDNIF